MFKSNFWRSDLQKLCANIRRSDLQILNRLGIAIFALFLISCFLSLVSLSSAAAPQELKNSINKKTQELSEINNKIAENQKNLEQTQYQGKTLQKEIGRLDLNIKQVVLSINASELTIDKLNLEIDSLGYTISDTELKIASKGETITKILQEIQQKEGETNLIIFLKNKSLAESVFEAQTLADLNHGLAVEIENLKGVKAELASQLQEKSEKKAGVEAETGNLKNRKIILADTKQDKQDILKQTKEKEQLYQKSLSELEKRQAEIAEELEKLEEELRLKIDPSALPAKRPGVLALPVSGILSQDYGATRFAKYGYRGKWHNGVDFAAPIGTPVFAAEKGKVIAVGDQDRYCYRGAYGKFIVIEHENNLTTLYAHLSLQVVREGDIVERGGLIGYVGRTGYATGPHLHFTVYASQTFRIGASKLNCGPEMPYGGDLNPMDYL